MTIGRVDQKPVRADVPDARDSNPRPQVLEAPPADDADDVALTGQRRQLMSNRGGQTHCGAPPPDGRQRAVEIREQRKPVGPRERARHVGPGVKQVPGSAVR